VTVLLTQAGTALIGKGLEARDEVVTSGQFKLAPGVAVAAEPEPLGSSEIGLEGIGSGVAAMPVSAMPNVDFPTIVVSATLPGGSPEVMADTVAQPLERYFAEIPGVTQITSQNIQGATSVTLQFELSRNIDGAATDVQAAINAATGALPKSPPSPPTYKKPTRPTSRS
jgi:hydrophobic/amphiphilic exporter-1 (mainly G- bacteria), HAE1 family